MTNPIHAERERESKPGRDIAYCIDANYAKGTNTTEKSRRQLVMEVHTIAYSKSHRDNGLVQARGKIDDESNTLSTGDGCTNQSTGNYVFTKGESVNNPIIMNPKMQNYKANEVCPAITATSYKEPPVTMDLDESTIRIRKLTPVETERLQGYTDGHTAFGRRPDGTIYEMSNTQRYKMCGNGISSPVPAYLFPKIFGTEHIRVMSLFSGCGGTELLLPSNFQVVGHCEFDKHASAVLNYHYPNIPNFHDVTQFVDKEVPEFDLLVGGFPCQSWSIAGLRKGYTDDRGQLIFNVYDIIRKHKPKMICLENVKGLLSHSKGDAFEAIMEYLSSLGYDLDFEVVNSKHFGLAQNRERVFIIGKLR